MRQVPGRLIDVGGHAMHVIVAGTGTPAVVVIPGLGESSAGWQAIQHGLASDTTVCTYDRPGLGWSDPAPGRQDHQHHAGGGDGARDDGDEREQCTTDDQPYSQHPGRG